MNVRTLKALFTATLCLWAFSLQAQSNLELSGLSWLESKQLEAQISFLQGLNPNEPADLDAVLLEDSAFLILEELRGLGYLQPEIKAQIELSNGEVQTAIWASEYSIQLEADMVAEFVHFEIIPGVRYRYSSVQVEGVSAIEPERVQRYFIPQGYLFGSQSSIYTEGSLDRRVGRLIQSLEEMGYRSARVLDEQIKRDAVTGEVSVELQIEEGPLYKVRRVEVITQDLSSSEETRQRADLTGDLFTADWERSFRVELRNAAYAMGYPDVKVRVERQDVVEEGGVFVVDLVALVDRGAQVQLKVVAFEGDPKTREAVLERKVPLDTNGLLNPLEVNKGQRAIMALGIFESVDIRYEPESGPERSVIYELEPNKRKSLDLLAGWGSYEQARAGFKWKHLNPFGGAHRYEAEAKQSFKASRLETTYSIPFIFNTPLTAYTRGEYAYREEISYETESTGGALGASWWLPSRSVRFSSEYSYFEQTSDRSLTSDFDSLEAATVASLTLRASMDRRDNFLQPSSGYSLFSSYEWASELLGGSVNYNRIEFGGSYHQPIFDSVLLHVGLRGGLIFSDRISSENIPFSSRFFSGGENSVRGYREGQASPLNMDGEEVGSESYVLINFELEQRLSQNVSIVEFIDGVYFGRDGIFDEATDFLYSVGIGLRYQTVVGPIRLEYGYNPDPRQEDTKGRLHLSVGYPF